MGIGSDAVFADGGDAVQADDAVPGWVMGTVRRSSARSAIAT
jgi:hypothetical protein